QDAGQLEHSALFADVFAIARRYRVRPVPDMTLIMVALVTAQGIGKLLDPDANIFDEAARYLVPILMSRGELWPAAATGSAWLTAGCGSSRTSAGWYAAGSPRSPGPDRTSRGAGGSRSDRAAARACGSGRRCR